MLICTHSHTLFVFLLCVRASHVAMENTHGWKCRININNSVTLLIVDPTYIFDDYWSMSDIIPTSNRSPRFILCKNNFLNNLDHACHTYALRQRVGKATTDVNTTHQHLRTHFPHTKHVNISSHTLYLGQTPWHGWRGNCVLQHVLISTALTNRAPPCPSNRGSQTSRRHRRGAIPKPLDSLTHFPPPGTCGEGAYHCALL